MTPRHMTLGAARDLALERAPQPQAVVTDPSRARRVKSLCVHSRCERGVLIISSSFLSSVQLWITGSEWRRSQQIKHKLGYELHYVRSTTRASWNATPRVLFLRCNTPRLCSGR